jgi:hypothetical protein
MPLGDNILDPEKAALYFTKKIEGMLCHLVMDHSIDTRAALQGHTGLESS